MSNKGHKIIHVFFIVVFAFIGVVNSYMGEYLEAAIDIVLMLSSLYALKCIVDDEKKGEPDA